MSVYRYYIPKLTAKDVTDDTLAQLGLSDRLRDCPLKKTRGSRIELHDILNNGPDGGNGVLVTPMPADRSAPNTYKRDACEFNKSQHDGADYWIVWEKANPPTPEGLKRWETVNGVHCELGDGRIWECPTVCTFGRYPKVPQSYSRVNGRIGAKVLPQYLAAWNLSGLWSLRLLEENRDAPVKELFGIEPAFNACLTFLSLNYRVADEEAALLGLLTDESMADIIDAAVDMAFMVGAPDDQKKRAVWQEVSEGMRSFLRGLGESTPITSQPEQTSN